MDPASLMARNTSYIVTLCYSKAVQWLRVDIVSAMSSISTVWKNLKRIQTPHSLFWDFRADKTFTIRRSGCRVQVWAPACHFEITPEGYSRRQSKVLTAKSMAKLWGPRSGRAWAGGTGERKHSAFLSRRRVSMFFLWNEIFDGIGEKLLPTKAVPNAVHSFAQSFDHSLVSEWKYDIVTKHHVRIESCAK